MSSNNLEKKKQIDAVLATYDAKLAIIKQKRDKIIADFLETLEKKKLEELRNSLKKLCNHQKTQHQWKQS